MSFAERTAMPLGFSRVKFGSFVRALTNQPLRVLRAEFGGLVVVLAMGLAFLALSCATERAGAQTTFTCSTATPSTNCALSIPGGDQTPNAPPAYAAANSSTLTVSGATGPVASIKVVLLGVTSSTGPWAGYSSTNENTYNSISWSSFLLEDPAGNQLDLLGGTGTGLDLMSGTQHHN
jgi:hypothetical protein